jgi:hypothetical protein
MKGVRLRFPVIPVPAIVKEIWAGVRPFFIRIAIDFLLTATLWVGLFLFKVMAHFMPIPNWAGEFVIHLHSLGTVAAVSIFVWYSVLDIIELKGGTKLLCLAW